MLKLMIKILDTILLVLLNAITYVFLMIGILVIWMLTEGIPLELSNISVLFNWNLIMLGMNVIVFYILWNNLQALRKSVKSFLDDLEKRLEMKLQKMKVELDEEEKKEQKKEQEKEQKSETLNPPLEKYSYEPDKVISSQGLCNKILSKEKTINSEKVEKLELRHLNCVDKIDSTQKEKEE